MKTNPRSFFAAAAFLLLSVPICLSQSVSSGDAAITERGPHHRVYEWTELEETSLGRAVERKRSYVELETGMHVQQADGTWKEARVDIQLTTEGAAATNTAHQVFFAANLNAPGTDGAVTLVTSDAKVLRSRVLGLGYYDGANAVLIAQTKDSIGLVFAPDRVLYTNAFDNADGVEADVEYVVSKSGLQQNVILRSQLPHPAEWGLNPETTRLQVLTEFYGSPVPHKQAKITRDGLATESLDFGAMKINGPGRAFSLGAEGEGEKPVRVYQQWTVLEGRTFLVEELLFALVDAQIQALERRRQGASLRQDRRGQGETVMAALKMVLPKPAVPKAADRMRMAKVEPSGRSAAVSAAARPAAEQRSNGLASRAFDPAAAETAALQTPLNSPRAFILDYSILAGATNLTLQADLTYLCTNAVVLYGTTTLESTVVKFSTSSSATITINGPVVCKTASHRPVFFIAKDSNAAGETIPDSTGTPSGYYGGGLILNEEAELHNVRFSHLRKAVDATAGEDVVLRDVQLTACGYALALDGNTAAVRNALIWNTATNFFGPGAISGEHLTIHNAARLAQDNASGGSSCSIRLTNCLLVAVTNLGNYATITTNSTAILSSDAGVFQTVAGGVHYLSASSPYRNAGSTNLNADLLAALKTKTTYPPIAFTNTAITNVSTLGPQAQRDTDQPDIGYGYDVLDWIFGGCDLNVDLTFAPGTAVGWFRYNSGWNHTGHGIHIADNKILNFDGRVDSVCWFAHQTMVQEQRIGYAPADPGTGAITGWPVSATNSPTAKVRFTRFSGLPLWRNYFRDDFGVLRVNALDCEFYAGCVGGYISYNALTNCLFYRSSFGLDGGVLDQSISLRNCTWYGGGLIINRWSGNDHQTPVSIRDCSLDGATVDTDDEHDGNPAITDYNYNAFLQGANRTTPQGANDVIVTNFNWQSSWFGNFYLPSNSALINAGSVTNAALVGLYHYTLLTAQTKETTSRLDIGSHFVAADGNGRAIDSDGDGVPDYFEDTNGNGNGNDDATSWQSYNSPNGLTSGNPIQVFTPLKQ